MSGVKVATFAGTALAAVLMAIPTLAMGQEAGATEVGEVVVTSRKREERLVDVPAAVTAISASDRQNLVVEDIDDYLRQVPGATLVASGPEYLNDVTIRGQGSGRLGFSETATGLYRDGLYMAGGGFGGRSLGRLDYLDASRVEVLRGPQGALFGRNSVGGAINVVSQAPIFNVEGNVTLRYSDPEKSNLEATVNLPLVADVLSLRVTGFKEDQRSGFTRNLTTGNDLDTSSADGYRVSLRWLPAEAMSVDLAYEAGSTDASAFGLGRRPLRADGTPLDPSPRERVEINREGGSLIENQNLFLTVKYDLEFADLSFRANTTTRDAERNNEDNDHFAGHSGIDVAPGATVLTPDYTVGQFEAYERSVAQLYLSSKAGGRFSWLVGIEYLTSEDNVVADPTFCPAYTGVAQPVTPGCFVGQAGTLTGVPAAVRSAGRLTMNHDEFTESLASRSLFGSLEYALGDATNLGLELRIQTDEKDYGFLRYSRDPLVYFGSGAVPAGLMAGVTIDPDGAGPLTAQPVQFCPPGLAGCAAGRETVDFDTGESWTFVTPTVTLRHKFSPTSSAYLRFSTGYRPGGFNTNLGPTTVRSQFLQQVLYDPEYAYSYEAGWKGKLLGVNLAAAVFYNWTNEVQVVSAPSATARGFVLQNSGDTHVTGYEIEARRSFEVGPGILSLSAALSGQKGEFEEGASTLVDTNGDGVPDVLDLEGNEVPRLRDYQLTFNAAYSFPITGNLRGFVSGSFQRAEGGFETPANDRDYEAYQLFDARVGLRTENLRFSIFGRNLGDEEYIVNILSTNEYYNQPRVIGAELALDF
jgi:outer membrane receptor protein involved in Fe transport